MKELADTPMDGRCGLAVKLLVQDRFEKRLEGGRRRIQAELEFADFVDERSQLRVAGF
jgi:hypothetical protein